MPKDTSTVTVARINRNGVIVAAIIAGTVGLAGLVGPLLSKQPKSLDPSSNTNITTHGNGSNVFNNSTIYGGSNQDITSSDGSQNPGKQPVKLGSTMYKSFELGVHIEDLLMANTDYPGKTYPPSFNKVSWFAETRQTAKDAADALSINLNDYLDRVETQNLSLLNPAGSGTVQMDIGADVGMHNGGQAENAYNIGNAIQSYIDTCIYYMHTTKKPLHPVILISINGIDTLNSRLSRTQLTERVNYQSSPFFPAPAKDSYDVAASCDDLATYFTKLKASIKTDLNQ